MKDIIKALNWRYATKKYDTTKKLTSDQENFFLEVLRLAPSSYGLQPWKFIVVKNPELREKLKAAAYGQTQLTDASHLVVFAVPKVIDDAFVDSYVKTVSEVRNAPIESLKGYSDMMKGAIAPMSPDARKDWAARQAYLALGFFLQAAAVNEIDATPMEGFDPKAVDEVLGLAKLGLESKVIAALGFRAADDSYATLPKVRNSKKQVIIEM